MEKVTEFLEGFGINLALIIAGIFGGILSINNKEDKLNLWQTFIVLASGGAIANYVTPVLSDLINISESTKYGFAFLLGFSGLEGVKWIIIQLKKRYSKDG